MTDSGSSSPNNLEELPFTPNLPGQDSFLLIPVLPIKLPIGQRLMHPKLRLIILNLQHSSSMLDLPLMTDNKHNSITK